MSMLDNELGPVATAEIRETSRITPDSTDEVRHIVLRIDDPSFRYLEGQSIGVMVPGPHAFGNKYHMRRYSIANDRTQQTQEGIELSILVRRCFYIDEINGEQYPGVASNYLCDLKVGDNITITGPFRSPFNIPQDPNANLLMIGTGTGVAPFRAFIQHIYKQKGGWKGKVRLFYGARSGMDMLYMNDQNSDITNYYDEESFQAFNAVISRPLSGEDEALERSIEAHAEEAWDLMQQPNTYVCIAGLTKVIPALDKIFSELAGSEQAWKELTQKMIDEGRWSQLFYS